MEKCLLKSELCDLPYIIIIHLHQVSTPAMYYRALLSFFFTASCRNEVELSRTHGPLTTTTNPAYEMINKGGGGGGGGEGGGRGGRGGGGQESCEYEMVGVSQGTGTLVAKDKTCEIPSPPSCQPLPTIPLSVAPPTGGDVGMAEEREEEDVYDNIPGDQ